MLNAKRSDEDKLQSVNPSGPRIDLADTRFLLQIRQEHVEEFLIQGLWSRMKNLKISYNLMNSLPSLLTNFLTCIYIKREASSNVDSRYLQTNESLQNQIFCSRRLVPLHKLKILISHSSEKHPSHFHILSMSANLSRIKSLNTLHLECSDPINSKYFIIILRTIRNLQILIKLHLDFSIIKINKIALVQLSLTIKKLRSLSNLTLRLNTLIQSITDRDMREISSALKHQPLLSVLKLNFDQCLEVGDTSMQELGKALTNLQRLSELELHFPKSEKLTINGAHAIYIALKNFSLLRRASLIFPNHNRILRLESETFIRSMKNVRSLAIDVSDENILVPTELLEINLTPLESLTELYLQLSIFQYKKINREAQLMSALSSLQSLSSLSLRFEISYNARTMLCLTKSLKRMPHLTSLNLDFSYLDLDDEFIREISFDLGGTPRLENLKLKLKEVYSFSDEDVNALCYDLCQFQSSLKTLDLDFSLCRWVTDACVNNLLSCLERLNKLTILALNVCGTSISEKGNERIFGLKINSKIMTSLKLQVDIYKKETIQHLCRILKVEQRPEISNFNFRKCADPLKADFNTLCVSWRGQKYPLDVFLFFELKFNVHDQLIENIVLYAGRLKIRLTDV